MWAGLLRHTEVDAANIIFLKGPVGNTSLGLYCHKTEKGAMQKHFLSDLLAEDEYVICSYLAFIFT